MLIFASAKLGGAGGSLLIGLVALTWLVVLPVVWAAVVSTWRLVAWCHERAGRPFPGHRFTRSRWGVRLGKAILPVWFAGIFVVPIGTGWIAERVYRAHVRGECRSDMVRRGGQITDRAVDTCVAQHYEDD